MNEISAWRHSETRAITPFLVSNSCLAEIGFRLSIESDFERNNPWASTIDREQLKSADFAPEFELSLDLPALEVEADVDPSDFQLSVVVRDPALWSSRALISFPLDEVPLTFRVPRGELELVAGNGGLKFEIVVTPRRNLEERFRRAWRKGQIVARREFVMSPPIDGLGFPIQIVPSDTFVARGLPKNAVWYIEWMDWLDFDRAPEDILCIFMNEETAEKLLQLAGNDALGNVLWRSVAADAVLEMCMKVFGRDPKPPEDPSGLLYRLIGTMQNAAATDLDGLVAQARSPEGWRYFRTHIQSAFEFGEKAKGLNVGGRRS